ncbi:MAG: hypothetical protein KDD15_03215, partial [Lewinella sp.]|nr:hypothetical protein [Lewinella sp.]
DKIITGGRESKDQFLGILTWKHYLPVLFAMGIVALIFLTLAKKYIFSPDKNGAIAMQDSSINSSDNLYEIYTDTLLEGKNEVLERNKLSEDEENGVVDELKTKKMLDKICMAENYLKGRGRNADNRAIELYEATVSNLSEGTLGKMDTQLLQRASMYKSDDEETKISIQTANKFYRSIFKPYIKFCNQN